MKPKTYKNIKYRDMPYKLVISNPEGDSAYMYDALNNLSVMSPFSIDKEKIEDEKLQNALDELVKNLISGDLYQNENYSNIISKNIEEIRYMEISDEEREYLNETVRYWAKNSKYCQQFTHDFAKLGIDISNILYERDSEFNDMINACEKSEENNMANEQNQPLENQPQDEQKKNEIPEELNNLDPELKKEMEQQLDLDKEEKQEENKQQTQEQQAPEQTGEKIEDVKPVMPNMDNMETPQIETPQPEMPNVAPQQMEGASMEMPNVSVSMGAAPAGGVEGMEGPAMDAMASAPQMEGASAGMPDAAVPEGEIPTEEVPNPEQLDENMDNPEQNPEEQQEENKEEQDEEKEEEKEEDKDKELPPPPKPHGGFHGGGGSGEASRSSSGRYDEENVLGKVAVDVPFGILEEAVRALNPDESINSKSGAAESTFEGPNFDGKGIDTSSHYDVDELQETPPQPEEEDKEDKDKEDEEKENEENKEETEENVEQQDSPTDEQSSPEVEEQQAELSDEAVSTIVANEQGVVSVENTKYELMENYQNYMSKVHSSLAKYDATRDPKDLQGFESDLETALDRAVTKEELEAIKGSLDSWKATGGVTVNMNDTFDKYIKLTESRLSNVPANTADGLFRRRMLEVGDKLKEHMAQKSETGPDMVTADYAEMYNLLKSSPEGVSPEMMTTLTGMFNGYADSALVTNPVFKQNNSDADLEIMFHRKQQMIEDVMSKWTQGKVDDIDYNFVSTLISQLEKIVVCTSKDMDTYRVNQMLDVIDQKYAYRNMVKQQQQMPQMSEVNMQQGMDMPQGMEMPEGMEMSSGMGGRM